tara:strand:+ start:4647 stop:5159 length:513 start_codon:yes stop_codon:yes gene_type:complete
MSLHSIFPLSIENSNAKLLLTPCPGSKELPLKPALQALKQYGANAVITLMTEKELQALSLNEIGATTKSLGLSWFHLPVTDDQTPDQTFNTLWQTAGPAIHRLLENEKSIAIHCKGGSGRTGLIAAQILLERGEALNKVVKRIQKLRPNAFNLEAQRDYIALIENNLASQ